MFKNNSSRKTLDKKLIGITGASGSLGKALTTALQDEGAYVIGLTHGSDRDPSLKKGVPDEWVSWSCGEEASLEKTLERLDILIINHGINLKGRQDSSSIDDSLEINALSTWRLMKIFEEIVLQKNHSNNKTTEIWINSSEAEVQPALSPVYELSKRLIGEIVSLKWNNLNESQKRKLRIRKLILGPFQSNLNPIGIMKPEFVAKQIIFQANLNIDLIIVSPNPITYLTIPIIELIRFIYSSITKKIK